MPKLTTFSRLSLQKKLAAFKSNEWWSEYPTPLMANPPISRNRAKLNPLYGWSCGVAKRKKERQTRVHVCRGSIRVTSRSSSEGLGVWPFGSWV